jgi:membrane protease YdiL (CAAX protease family)
LETLALLLMPFGVVYVGQVVFLGVIGVADAWVGIVLSFVQQLSMGLLVAWWVRRRYGSLEPLGLRRGGWTRRDVGAGVAMGLLAVMAMGAVIQITQEVVKAFGGNPPLPLNPIVDYGRRWELVTILMALLLAPVCEEIAFRGLLFGGLRRRFRFGWAAVWSAAPFALLHADPIRLLGLAVAGVLLAAVYERRRTLVASIAAHFTLNLVAVVALLSLGSLR